MENQMSRWVQIKKRITEHRTAQKTKEKSLRKASSLTVYTEVEIILKYEIIELVKLSATKDVRNVSFGFFRIICRTRNLISIKTISNTNKNIS